jgi:serine/threonine protein kinase
VRVQAPETKEGEESTQDSDVWSLGATLAEVLLGKSITNKVGEFEPRFLEKDYFLQALGVLPPSVDKAYVDGLIEVILRCLAERPCERPWAKHVFRDLEAMLSKYAGAEVGARGSLLKVCAGHAKCQ